MDEYQNLSHTVWDCKYHVVWIPKCLRKALYEQLRKHMGPVFRTLAMQKESKIEEGRLMSDHVHMLISIPPRYGVRRWLVLSKARVLSTLPGSSRGEKRTLPGRAFGPEATSYPRWAETKKSSGNTSRSYRPRTNAWINWLEQSLGLYAGEGKADLPLRIS
jgi:putative transposase